MTLVIPPPPSLQPSSGVEWYKTKCKACACACVCNECPRCATPRAPLIYMFWKYKQLSDTRAQIFHHLCNWLLASSTIHLRRNAPNKNAFWLLFWLWNSLISPESKRYIYYDLTYCCSWACIALHLPSALLCSGMSLVLNTERRNYVRHKVVKQECKTSRSLYPSTMGQYFCRTFRERNCRLLHWISSAMVLYTTYN